MHPYPKDRHLYATPVDLALELDARRIEVPSPAQLPPVLDLVEDLMRFQGYPDRDIFAVTLALHEAATNGFRHGNRGDPGKSIRVRYLVTAAEVLLEVADQGPGFDPGRVPDPFAGGNGDRPRGRGLFLMRAYMTWVSFNREGNRVTLVRQRSPS